MIPLKDLNPSRTTPWVTWSVLLLCVVVFAFELSLDPVSQRVLFDQFAFTPEQLTLFGNGQGSPWVLVTVVTSMFLHGGFLHVLGNLWYLRIFGDNVEDNFGRLRFTVFYVLCGLAAALTQWAVDPLSAVPMVGASGAIAGVLAAYLLLYPRARVYTVVPIFIFLQFFELPAFLVIALWFVLQLFNGVASLGLSSGGGVAYWAHIGGFLAGLALTTLFRAPLSRRDQQLYQ